MIRCLNLVAPTGVEPSNRGPGRSRQVPQSPVLQALLFSSLPSSCWRGTRNPEESVRWMLDGCKLSVLVRSAPAPTSRRFHPLHPHHGSRVRGRAIETRVGLMVPSRSRRHAPYANRGRTAERVGLPPSPPPIASIIAPPAPCATVVWVGGGRFRSKASFGGGSSQSSGGVKLIAPRGSN